MTLSSEESFDAAESVFIGRVAEIEPVGSWQRVTFNVKRSFKGDPGNSVSLFQGPFDLDMQFESDRNYIVFANRSGGRLFASSCSRTRLLGPPQWFVEQRPGFHHFGMWRPRYFSYSEIAFITALCVTLSISSGIVFTRLWKRWK